MIEKVEFGDPLGALGALADDNANNCKEVCNETCRVHNTAKIDYKYQLAEE